MGTEGYGVFVPVSRGSGGVVGQSWFGTTLKPETKTVEGRGYSEEGFTG